MSLIFEDIDAKEDELWFSRILKELKEHLVTAKNRDEAVSYVSHPLNAYQLIKKGHNGIMPCQYHPIQRYGLVLSWYFN